MEMSWCAKSRQINDERYDNFVKYVLKCCVIFDESKLLYNDNLFKHKLLPYIQTLWHCLIGHYVLKVLSAPCK